MPLLFVPNLGIAPPWIFDLVPGSSFIQHVTAQGFALYLLDWGRFGPEERRAHVEDAVAETLPRMWDAALDDAKADSLIAALVLTLVGARPRVALAGFVDMAGPVDFTRAGVLPRWLDRRWFPLGRLVDILGSVPPSAFWLAGSMLQPTAPLSVTLDAIVHSGSERIREFIPVPGAFFGAWVRDFYQENRLYCGTLRLAGAPVRLDRVTCPVLAAAARHDPIAPPASVHALLGVVGSHDALALEVPGSHLPDVRQ